MIFWIWMRWKQNTEEKIELTTNKVMKLHSVQKDLSKKRYKREEPFQ